MNRASHAPPGPDPDQPIAPLQFASGDLSPAPVSAQGRTEQQIRSILTVLGEDGLCSQDMRASLEAELASIPRPASPLSSVSDFTARAPASPTAHPAPTPATAMRASQRSEDLSMFAMDGYIPEFAQEHLIWDNAPFAAKRRCSSDSAMMNTNGPISPSHQLPAAPVAKA